MATLTTKRLFWFKVKPQVRQEFDESELRPLGESMKALGQLQPVLARTDGAIDRWRETAPCGGSGAVISADGDALTKCHVD